VTEGTVTRWLKQVGDTVQTDEPLLEVSTDKVDTEIPSPTSGTLLEIKVSEDETVEVGAELAVIGEEGESAGEAGGGAEQEAEEQAQSAQEQPAEEAPQEQPTSAEQEQPREEQPREEQPPEQEQPVEQEQPAAREQAGGGAATGTPVTLPALGESVTEGTVTRWLKQVGDTVQTDEPLLEVSTDKVDTEIPSPTSGTLLEIKVSEDETVEVGAELAIIGSADAAPARAEEQPQPETQQTEQREAPPQQAPEPQQAPSEQAAPQPEPAQREAEPQQAPQQPAASGAEASYVTPLVRKLAAEHGVDLASVNGTGVGGRIRKQDVLEAAKAKEQPAAAPSAAPPAAEAEAAPPAPAPSPLRGKTEKMSRLRQVIAARMVESLHVSAQLTTVVEVDVTGVARLREQKKTEFAQREGVKLSFMPFFAKAAIDALKSHPSLNAAIDTDKKEITYFDAEHLAIAVDTERGLLTPVIKDAGDLSIAGLARKIADIAERTRTNKITPDELSGGTFTLTNTGSRGALFDTPIINQPQVAIVGTGAVVKRPVVIDDPNLGETIAVRQMVYLALTYDHRIVDGADAARFLTDVKRRLEAAQFDV
jgi:2-oxoglutarate dehydrogenase E2 component (dihydrolipoamide succinyltransferase)